MPEPTFSDADVIGALRLGLEASADARTTVKLTRALLEMAAPTESAAVRPVDVLLRGIRSIGATLSVTEHEPRGRIGRRCRDV